MKTVLTVLVVVLGFNVARAEVKITSMVAKAHQAFLADDGDQMLENIHQALIESQNDPVIVKNLTGLYDKWVVEHQKAPQPKIQLSPNIDYMYFESALIKRYDKQQTAYQLSMGLGFTDASRIESMQLMRYPNEILIDTDRKIGDFYGLDGNEPTVMAEQTDDMPKLGLYTIRIKAQNQPAIEAWVLVTNRSTSNGTPLITQPVVKQVFKTATPEMKWENFRSQSLLPTDKVVARFQVKSLQQTQDGYEEVDAVKVEMDPVKTKFLIGDKAAAKEYEGAESLQPGPYVFRLKEVERNRFGPLLMMRSSVSKVSFSINLN